MPWCPKCKTEYREGFKVCADCGSELTAEEPEDPFGEEDWEELQDQEFLLREAIEAARNGEIAVPGSEEAARYGEFVLQEAAEAGDSERQDTEALRTEAMAALGAAEAVRSGSGFYQDSSERASENRSSAWALLYLGAIGLIVVIMGAAGLLPFHPANPYLAYGVMGAVFILFVVAGLVSRKNAKIFEEKAESEKSLRQILLDWCLENLNAADIDEQLCCKNVSKEIAYFRRTSYIRERLNRQFVNLDQGFLEQFIDDRIYEKIFGDREV